MWSWVYGVQSQVKVIVVEFSGVIKVRLCHQQHRMVFMQWSRVVIIMWNAVWVQAISNKMTVIQIIIII